MQEASSTLWVRRGAVIAAAVLVAVLAYILLRGGDDDGSKKNVVAADAAEVQKLAAEQEHTPYWAGPGGAQTFEWTDTSDGRVFVRYLTGGAQINDQRPNFLTVGTYPVPGGDGLAAVKQAAKQPGAKTFRVKGGALGLVNEKKPTSVYLAYPGSPDQIEVYDPDPAEALKLVTSGQIQPIP
jgi:hypothetical protein